MGWEEYRAGFGDVTAGGEFWAGNEFISELTAARAMVLRVELGAHDGATAWAEYSTFRSDFPHCYCYFHSIVILISTHLLLLFAELTARTRTTVSGWEVTPVTPATVSLPTTATSSPPWTGTTTWHPSVAPVPRHMAGAGGSTGGRRFQITLSMCQGFVMSNI